MLKVYNAISDTWIDSETMLIADRLVKLRNEKTMWEVIDEIINWWMKKHPSKWKAHLIEIKDLKDTRKNKFASTKDKSLRYLLDVPELVLAMIRKLYDTKEAPMDGSQDGKRWMLKFAKRYPFFTVPDKL